MSKTSTPKRRHLSDNIHLLPAEKKRLPSMDVSNDSTILTQDHALGVSSDLDNIKKAMSEVLTDFMSGASFKSLLNEAIKDAVENKIEPIVSELFETRNQLDAAKSDIVNLKKDLFNIQESLERSDQHARALNAIISGPWIKQTSAMDQLTQFVSNQLQLPGLVSGIVKCVLLAKHRGSAPIATASTSQPPTQCQILVTFSSRENKYNFVKQAILNKSGSQSPPTFINNDLTPLRRAALNKALLLKRQGAVNEVRVKGYSIQLKFAQGNLEKVSSFADLQKFVA